MEKKNVMLKDIPIATYAEFKSICAEKRISVRHAITLLMAEAKASAGNIIQDAKDKHKALIIDQ